MGELDNPCAEVYEDECIQRCEWDGYDLLQLISIMQAVLGGAVVLVKVHGDEEILVNSDSKCRYLMDISTARYHREVTKR